MDGRTSLVLLVLLCGIWVWLRRFTQKYRQYRAESSILNYATWPFVRASLARQFFPPAYWCLTRRSLPLEEDLRDVRLIFAADGLPVPRIPIRALRQKQNENPVLAMALGNLIIIGDEAASYQPAQRFWVVCHEVGHRLDYLTERHGHPLFDLVRDLDNEGFANSVGWYCLHRRAYTDNGKPFDWEYFSERLPVLVKRIGI